jgi:hypothetical protein
MFISGGWTGPKIAFFWQNTLPMRSLLTGLFVLGFLFRIYAQHPNSPITGWKMQEDDGHVSFAPAMIFGQPNFHYDVYPPEKGVSEDIDGWLSRMAESDVLASGFTLVPNQSQSRDVQSFKLYSVMIKDKAGKQWLANYMAYARPDHSIRYARIIEVPNATVAKNNMNMAVQHFIKISKEEGGLVVNGSTTGSRGSGGSGGGSTGGSPTGSRPASGGRAETPTTAPGQGVKASELKGIVLHQEYGVGVGGMMIIKYNPYVLLNDGSVYSDPYVCIYDLDVAQSREVEPKKWGTWKLESATTLVVVMNADRKPDKWEGKAHWFWADPAKKGEKLDGTWSTIGGGGNTAYGGGTMIVSSNVITFNNQGQFTTLSTGGGTTSGPAGTVTAYSNKDAAGTYLFDGYSLELQYGNGKVVRKTFCSYDDTREVWVLNSSAYTPDDKTDKKFKRK